MTLYFMDVVVLYTYLIQINIIELIAAILSAIGILISITCRNKSIRNGKWGKVKYVEFNEYIESLSLSLRRFYNQTMDGPTAGLFGDRLTV